MHFNSHQVLDGGVLERAFTLGDIPGLLWTPRSATSSEPAPVILLGHPGGCDKMYGRLVARAMAAANSGFAAATIELPGSGGRRPLPEVDEARRELRQAITSHQLPTDDVIDRLVLPLVEQAVPEWRAALVARI